ncbi:branched-chain amino acid ABC transporter substrate-binding protein [Variovorax ginsengisoli]|uniref:Branched-chain amino acid transport system substrate-binding protein n=1 Tax=Variovorax ginsengisoli TaxID=363844 RepID=A0ABT9SES4_9BURK|nr:branched-chain amino acid ABC transporter substrate-binding protein [Variovorax ginsengisoli]MDP9902864.1 branched-chain amino acid transport system substrate-binding protein [Variovorax ginsengisoli]
MSAIANIKRIALLALTLGLAASFGAKANEIVKIAFVDVLTGPFAATGQGALNQLREVVSQLNATAQKDDPVFEIVPFDGKGTPQESANALRAAYDQKIRFLTQGGGSGVAFALVDAINKQAQREETGEMVYLNYAAMDPGLTNDKCSFWHFRFFPSSEMQIEALTTYLKDQSGVKKVYLLNQNYTHGQQVAKASRAYLSKKRPDVEIVGEDYVPIGAVRDYAPYVAKIARSGADTVITSNWGSDLALLLKASREFGLSTNFYTLNANNPGIPSQIGEWGVNRVNVIWNWGSNAPAPVLEKIATSFKQKTGEDFIFAAHWNGMQMLRAAMTKAKSTEPRKVAFALEGMRYQSPVGEVVMRADDHQLQAPMYLGVWTKKGERGVRYEAETTGYGFRSEVVWGAAESTQPTSCKMSRPSK